MTEEEIKKSVYTLIVDHNPQDSAQLIWNFYQNFQNYTIVKGKIVNKETGKEFSEDFPIKN